MKRYLIASCVMGVMLGVAAPAAGQATQLFYTIESVNQFGGNPLDFVTHEANGWLFLESFPIYGDYSRMYDGVVEEGFVVVEVNGKVSADGADGNFHGPITLYIGGQACIGRFRAKRVDYFEQGSWLLQCPDGSIIQDWFHFWFNVPEFVAEGTGVLLIPKD